MKASKEHNNAIMIALRSDNFPLKITRLGKNAKAAIIAPIKMALSTNAPTLSIFLNSLYTTYASPKL